jgi:hypothetical protein
LRSGREAEIIQAPVKDSHIRVKPLTFASITVAVHQISTAVACYITVTGYGTPEGTLFSVGEWPLHAISKP